MKPWLVYVLLSADRRSTYVGITTDLERRLEQHNGVLPGGAKSTRRGRPWTIGTLYGPFDDRSQAQIIERRVKNRRGAARLDA